MGSDCKGRITSEYLFILVKTIQDPSGSAGLSLQIVGKPLEMKLQHQHWELFPFVVFWLRKRLPSAWQLCSYHGYWHQGRRFQIYFSPFSMLLFASPSAAEKLSWDQSVVLEHSLILHRGSVLHGSGQDKTGASFLGRTERAELLFSGSEPLLMQAHWGMGQSCLCPHQSSPAPHSQTPPAPHQQQQFLLL